jgi:hypothetical protein
MTSEEEVITQCFAKQNEETQQQTWRDLWYFFVLELMAHWKLTAQ